MRTDKYGNKFHAITFEISQDDYERFIFIAQTLQRNKKDLIQEALALLFSVYPVREIEEITDYKIIED